MAVLKFLLLAGIFWSSVAGFGFLPDNRSPEERWAHFFWRKPAEKADKLREIRALSPFSKPPRGVQADVCYTDECLDTSLMLLRSINFSVNPCDDFFEFSCGKWIADNPIPPRYSSWTHFHILLDEINRMTQEILTRPDDPSDMKPLKQAKQFFADCVNTDAMEAEGVAHLLAILTLDGGWPAITQNWTPGGFDLFSVVAQARREFFSAIILNTHVIQDYMNSSRSLIYLDQPELFMYRDVLLNQEVFKPRIDAYIKYFVSVATEMAKITNIPVVESELIDQAKDIIAFETRLAEISSADEDRTDVERTYNPYKLDAYQEEIDRIEVVNPHAKVNYKSVLDLIFLTSGITIRPDEDIVVAEKEYLTKLIQILDTTDIKTIANYVHWRIVAALAPQTLQVFRDIKFEFDKVHYGLAQPYPRNESCASVSLNLFGYAIGVKYVEEFFEEDAKTNVNLMVENLRTVFHELLDEIDWMDEETRTNAHTKVTKMGKFMAYPDWILNRTLVEQEYEKLEIAPGFFLRSTLAANQWESNIKFDTLRQVVSKDMWLLHRVHPAVVNAYYAPQSNSIIFPGGFLKPPAYRTHGPEYINYGAIGGVIGHEITHGFDMRGSQFDEEGNAENWWSEEILLRYREKTQCFIEQYSGYETPVGNVDGNKTITENVGDNGGIHQSYLAYRNWVANNNGGLEEPRLPGLEEFTPDQLFFLGWGHFWCENISDEGLEVQLLTDLHSPARFRVIGPLHNLQDFADKWNCPRGSYMNPERKCVLW